MQFSPPFGFSRAIGYLSVVVFACAVVSCGDDPELVSKSREQQLEITKLRGELALVEEKLKNLPPDRTEELAEAKELEVRQLAEIKKLEEEFATLQARKRELEREFESYQRKYVIR